MRAATLAATLLLVGCAPDAEEKLAPTPPDLRFVTDREWQTHYLALDSSGRASGRFHPGWGLVCVSSSGVASRVSLVTGDFKIEGEPRANVHCVEWATEPKP